MQTNQKPSPEVFDAEVLRGKGALAGIEAIEKQLGLTSGQSFELFFAKGWDAEGERVSYPLHSITPALAAKTLRRFLGTSEVVWEAV